MNPNNLPIGIFDSGIGGLTVLKELESLFPHERFIYLGDTARTPYGPKDPATIIRYSKECTEFLLNKGIKILVVACNTASSLALAELEARCPCPVVGTIEPAISSALKVTSRERIGVIGTRATINSEVYTRALAAYSNLKIISKACPLFVPLVEEEILEGPIVDQVVEMYLSDLLKFEIDTLILGCTHYPLLKIPISNFFNCRVNLIECSAAIANQVGLLLENLNLSSRTAPPNMQTEFFVTDGQTSFENICRMLLGRAPEQLTIATI